MATTWTFTLTPSPMGSTLTPAEFATKWSGSTTTERAASQEHFIDLCRMIGGVGLQRLVRRGPAGRAQHGSSSRHATRSSRQNDCPVVPPAVDAPAAAASVACRRPPDHTADRISPTFSHRSQVQTGIRSTEPVSYTHLQAHETDSYLVCRL